MEYNATTHEQKGRVQVDAHAQFGLVGAAAMHDLNVIQGPNVTCDARDKTNRGGRRRLIIQKLSVQYTVQIKTLNS